jgi:hypothetical protein
VKSEITRSSPLAGGGFNPGQQPLREKPAISVRLSEPPSVEGTCGAQMDVNEWLDVDAVETADWVEESGDSPDSSRGT